MKAIHHLQLRSNCLYLGGEGNNAEKLSGGFYDHTFIPEFAGEYFRHKYFAITYIFSRIIVPGVSITGRGIWSSGMPTRRFSCPNASGKTAGWNFPPHCRKAFPTHCSRRES